MSVPESMTRSPWVLAKPDGAFARGPQTAFDTALGWRLVNPKMAEMYGTLQMGETAERVAAKYEVDREAQDEFALRSHRNAVAAQQAGRFGPEIVPVQVPQRKGEPLLLTQDEGPRADSSPEALAGLRPAFQKDGLTLRERAPLVTGSARGQPPDRVACCRSWSYKNAEPGRGLIQSNEVGNAGAQMHRGIDVPNVGFLPASVLALVPGVPPFGL